MRATVADQEQPKLSVKRHDVSDGYVIFKAGKNKSAFDARPAYLEDALRRWQRSNPEFKVRAALPSRPTDIPSRFMFGLTR